ncbi:hypothetical protein JQX13_10645 [Archangium violaceum]|uniref:hypothetical protein n=1 Tax=Archangium violaceum TaxID=83451 RepID=UPI00193C627F|nr:hypothetical protein [Archangium violaceum]QRK13556.1 hypothetical protein JQX13_10645 [Archangium violaceum]
MRSGVFVSMGLAVLLVGCASGLKAWEVPGEEAIYDAPLEEVWPSVRQFFTDNGLPFREDKGNFVLETEWREEFGGSRVAGYWHRYLVQGKRETPTRSKLWIIRVTRTANRTLARAGDEIDWSVDRGLGAGGPGGGSDIEASPDGMDWYQSAEDLAKMGEMPRGENGIVAGSAQGSRDLVMEWKVYQSLAPGLARREEPSARGAEAPEVKKGAPLAALAVECGQPIAGLAARVKPGGVLLLGELHGTQEVPRFIAQSACQTAASGTPVTVGLELPVVQQERVATFLRSAGTEEDWLKLMEAPFWRNPYQDGRSSEAMANLLEQLRLLRARGLDVDVFVFDHPGTKGQAHEDAMAATVLSHVRQGPGRFFLVVSGNIHPRTVQGLPWDASFKPMGLLLSGQLEDVVALDMAYDSGSAWICAAESTNPRLECGVRPARGKDNGDRFFVHLFERRNKEGYHGVFYVGPVTASLPAVNRGLGRPGATDDSRQPPVN